MNKVKPSKKIKSVKSFKTATTVKINEHTEKTFWENMKDLYNDMFSRTKILLLVGLAGALSFMDEETQAVKPLMVVLIYLSTAFILCGVLYIRYRKKYKILDLVAFGVMVATIAVAGYFLIAIIVGLMKGLPM